MSIMPTTVGPGAGLFLVRLAHPEALCSDPRRVCISTGTDLERHPVRVPFPLLEH